MPVGYSDLKNVLRLPSTWDLNYMKTWQSKDGVTFDRISASIGTALTLFNRSLASGYWSKFYFPTTELGVQYPVGGESEDLPEVTEYGQPDPIYGDFTGHMIPMKDYGGALGWTYLAMRRMAFSRYVLDIRRLIERSENTWQRKLLTRLFSSAAETVGATGVSAPFADGGTADASFIPPTYNGKTFLATHSHFTRQTDDAAGRLAAIKAMILNLIEHGYTSPFDLVIPEVDATDWAAVTGFKYPERGYLTTQGVEVRALIDENEYLGLIETDRGWARVRLETRLPANYAGLFKPFGYGSPNNPLAVRYEEGFPLGLSMVATPSQFPLQDAIAYFTFGAGVANRLAGAAAYFAAAGNYVNPTIG